MNQFKINLGSIDNENWEVIKTHKDDYSLKGKGSTKTWKLKCGSYYRYFRIKMTSTNHTNNWYLACSGIELYGDALVKNFFNYVSDFDKNGIIYGLGSFFGTKPFLNPAKTGIVFISDFLKNCYFIICCFKNL